MKKIFFLMLLFCLPVSAENRTIVFAGDSMIELGDWPNLLKECYQCGEIVNAGVGGNTTRNFSKRYERDVLSLNPSIVMIQIGTNDFNYDGYTPKKAFELIKNVALYTLEINSESRVYIFSVFPVLNDKLKNNKIVSLNTMLFNEFSDSKIAGIEYVDLYKKFVLHETSSANPSWMIGEHTAHLNEAGYQRWASFIMPYLTKIEE